MSKPNKQQSTSMAEDHVFHLNYDLYPDKDSMPDVSFYQELYKYKSVQDYLDQKKKLERKKKRQKRRKKMLKSVASADSNFLDFYADQYNYFPPFSDTGEYPVTDANMTGGLYDHVTPAADFDDKPIIGPINYGVEKDYPDKPYIRNQDFYVKLVDALSDGFKNLVDSTQDFPYSAEPPIYGMESGISPVSDQDDIYQQSGYDAQYGYDVTDSGNTSYLGVPFPTN